MQLPSLANMYLGSIGIIMKTNYHTHTERCHHAEGSDEAYVKSAIAAGFEELGFSDHTPWPFEGGFKSRIRMPFSQYKDYIESIQTLQQKYQQKIKLRIGLECEYLEEYADWLKELRGAGEIDYLIFGNHFAHPENSSLYEGYFGETVKTPEMLKKYGDAMEKGIESGLFSCIAHPDLFMRCYPEFDSYCETVSEQICRKAKEENVLLEFNISGFPYCEQRGYQGYPKKEFWEIAKAWGCQCIIGFDAHNNIDLEETVYYNRGLDMIEEIGITRVDTLPFVK